MLHVLHVDYSGGEVLEVMHHKLLLVRHENSYTMLLTEQFKTPLGHFSPFLNLLKATEVKRRPQFGKCRIEIYTLLLDLVTQELHLLLKAFDSIFFEHYIMIPFLLKGPRHLIHCCTDPHVKVRYLVKEEGLEKLHFPLHVSQIALVNLIENANTGIIDS